MVRTSDVLMLGVIFGSPKMGAGIRRRQQPISLVLFAATNLGVLSRYSDFLREQPATLLFAVLVGFALAGIALPRVRRGEGTERRCRRIALARGFRGT